MAIFMLETLKLSKTLKSSRDDFNVLDNFNVSSVKTANADSFPRKSPWLITSLTSLFSENVTQWKNDVRSYR